MHNLSHQEYMKAAAQSRRLRAVRGRAMSHPPPGRLRRLTARALLAAAGVVDREAVRRAVA